MKQLILLVTFLLAATPASADVFKCHMADGVIYSEMPCANNAMVVNTTPVQPSAADAQAANDQTTRDNAYVANSASERAARDAQAYRPPAISVVTASTWHSPSVYTNGRRAEREEEEEEHERHRATSAGNSGAPTPRHAPVSPTPARTTGPRAANLH